MRCYFHLLSPYGMIRDDVGVEVTDMRMAEAEALKAIEEIRQEDNCTDKEWQGWRLNVTDCSGHLLLSISLSRSQNSPAHRPLHPRVFSS
jgi:hypothetical protein